MTMMRFFLATLLLLIPVISHAATPEEMEALKERYFHGPDFDHESKIYSLVYKKKIGKQGSLAHEELEEISAGFMYLTAKVDSAIILSAYYKSKSKRTDDEDKIITFTEASIAGKFQVAVQTDELPVTLVMQSDYETIKKIMSESKNETEAVNRVIAAIRADRISNPILYEHVDNLNNGVTPMAKKKPEKAPATQAVTVGMTIDLSTAMSLDFTGLYGLGYPVSYISNEYLNNLRLGLLFNVAFRLADYIYLGIETGGRFGYMLYPGSLAPFTVDFPFRGLLRFGKKDLFFQLFGGYTLSLGPAYLTAPEAGFKVNIKGFSFEGAYFFNNIHTLRVGLGASIPFN